jgi:hypothetical protein
MLGSRATTPDDRGRTVDLVLPAQLTRANADLAAAPALGKFLQWITRTESRRFDWRRAPVAIGGVLLIIFGSAAYNSLFPGGAPIIRSIIFWGGLVTLALGLRILARRDSAPVLASTMVSFGVCGSCGYTLQGLTPDPDGCLVCPECGAAWLEYRLTRPHWSNQREVPRRPPWYLRLIGRIPRDDRLFGPDSRGAYFRMLDKRLHLLPPVRRAELGPARVRTLRRSLCRIGLGWRWLLALLPFTPIALSFAAVGGNWTKVTRAEGLWIYVLIFAIIQGLLLLACIGTIRGHIFVSPARRGRAAAELGVCNVCGRDLALHGVAQPDRCTLCTGCGAAWAGVPGGAPTVPAEPAPAAA